MNSELRRSRIFHRYHQAKGQVSEKRDTNRKENAVTVTPTRRRAYPASTKSSSSRTTTTTSNVVDDLTLGYHSSPGHRFATERNPREYEASPISSRSFRIVSLDGCYEDQVSVLSDSSSSLSSSKIRNVPIIPALPRCVMTKRDINVNRLKKEGRHKEETTKAMPPSANTARRRRSSHSRSQFVFDGNVCFSGTSPPPPLYLATQPTLAYPSPVHSSPLRASFPGAMGMKYPPMAPITTSLSMSPSTTPMMPLPPSAMVPISPPTTSAYSSDSSHLVKQQQQQQQQKMQQRHIQLRKEGRKTPPPTPEEQRRRNRAMPSVQYEVLVLNQLRREQFQKFETEELQRQYTW